MTDTIATSEVSYDLEPWHKIALIVGATLGGLASIGASFLGIATILGRGL